MRKLIGFGSFILKEAQNINNINSLALKLILLQKEITIELDGVRTKAAKKKFLKSYQRDITTVFKIMEDKLGVDSVYSMEDHQFKVLNRLISEQKWDSTSEHNRLQSIMRTIKYEILQ